VDKPTRKAIRVDYKCPIRKVFTDIFKFLVPRRRQAESGEAVVTGNGLEMSATFTVGINTAREAEVFEDSGEPATRAHGPLNILYSASYASSLKNHLPSWLPDWSDTSMISSIDDIYTQSSPRK
jgi:hypothetical protein